MGSAGSDEQVWDVETSWHCQFGRRVRVRVNRSRAWEETPTTRSERRLGKCRGGIGIGAEQAFLAVWRQRAGVIRTAALKLKISCCEYAL